MSPDLGFLLATDEDFTPYRQVATLEDGTVVRAGSGSDTPQVTPGNPFSTPDTVFLGRGCDVDGALLTASQTGATTGVVERGSCTFTEKVANIQDAGYSGAVVVNSSVPGNCSGAINVFVEGGIPAFFFGRDTGSLLFGAPYDEDACQAGGVPFGAAVGTVGQGFSVESVFEGWGYVRLYDIDVNAGDDNRVLGTAVDTYAVPESQDARYAEEFGDLSVHEVAIDPRYVPSDRRPGLAYFSYYAAGLRVVEYGPRGVTEVGAFIDGSGNNFWGVEVYERGGKTFVLASDRDYGLYVFEYTGKVRRSRP